MAEQGDLEQDKLIHDSNEVKWPNKAVIGKTSISVIQMAEQGDSEQGDSNEVKWPSKAILSRASVSAIRMVILSKDQAIE